MVFIIDNLGKANILSWQSRKIKRVCNSTISAECRAAVEAVNASVYLTALLKETLGPMSKDIDIRLLVDNKALVDAVTYPTSVEDKRLRIDISYLRECIKNNEIEDIFWIASQDNVSNALTKQGASVTKLTEVLQGKCKFDFCNNIFV